MDQDNVDDTLQFPTDKAAARKKLESAGRTSSPDVAAREIESTFTPTDAALQVGDGEFQEFFLSCTQDGLGPGSQCEWLAQHIPGVEARLLDEHSHRTLVKHVPQSHAWLSEHL